MEVVEVARCRVCEFQYPLSCFVRDKGRKSGYARICKPCFRKDSRAKMAALYETGGDKLERVLQQRAAANRRWYQRNKAREVVKARMRYKAKTARRVLS